MHQQQTVTRLNGYAGSFEPLLFTSVEHLILHVATRVYFDRLLLCVDPIFQR